MSRKRELLQKYRWILNLIIKVSKILPNKFYLKLLKAIRHHDNYVAMFVRYICLKNCAKSCGDNVALFSGVYLYRLHNLEIGDNVSIHPMCYIDAGGNIKIGDNVSIAHNTSILSEEHLYSDTSVNIKDQGCINIPTLIENNVWVGAGVRVLAGSKINSGSVVAAGAVVKGEVASNSIVGGVPAKLLKERN